jgi:hypothetical protein
VGLPATDRAEKFDRRQVSSIAVLMPLERRNFVSRLSCARCYAHFEMVRTAAVFVSLAVILNGAAKKPEFQDYPSEDISTGAVAGPRLTATWSEKYRTRIRLGAKSQEGFH